VAIVLGVAAALVPGLLLLWYFVKRDRFPEPPGLVWKTFGFGFLIIIPVIPLEFLLRWPFLDAASLPAKALGLGLIGAALPEEALKLAVLVWYCARKDAFDEPMDGIVYGAAVSLGFATFENVLYVAGGGLGTALLRAFTAVPGHAALGAIMGCYIGLARFLPHRRRLYMGLAFVVPVALHGLYDYPPMLARLYGVAGVNPGPGVGAGIFLGMLAVLAIEITWALILQSRLARSQKQRLRAARPAPNPTDPAGAGMG
jgi:RsiW-degrading membrane proteinase PrsW (M82 family)